MTLSRRSFFAKLAGAVVAAKVVPSLASPVYGYSGGAHIGWIALDLRAHEQEFLETVRFTKEQVAEWFNVPPELIADSPTPLARTSDELLEDSVVDIGAWMRRQGL